jgi:CRP-like cAMP-binding protein
MLEEGGKAMIQEKTSLAPNLLDGLPDTGIAKVFSIGSEYTYEEGVVCQVERQMPKYVEIILEGKVGVEVNISSAYFQNKLILDWLGPRDSFGLSALTQEAAWSKLRALETTRVMRIDPDQLLDLCEQDKEIGYAVMKNLSRIIVSRLRSERNLMLRAITEIKVFNL